MNREQEVERIRGARIEVAIRLQVALEFALGAGMANEAAMIAKLIDATLSGAVVQMYRKVTGE